MIRCEAVPSTTFYFYEFVFTLFFSFFEVVGERGGGKGEGGLCVRGALSLSRAASHHRFWFFLCCCHWCWSHIHLYCLFFVMFQHLLFCFTSNECMRSNCWEHSCQGGGRVPGVHLFAVTICAEGCIAHVSVGVLSRCHCYS